MKKLTTIFLFAISLQFCTAQVIWRQQMESNVDGEYAEWELKQETDGTYSIVWRISQGGEMTEVLKMGSSGLSVLVGGLNLLPIGTISAYGGSSAPTGWLLCDGTAVSRTTYSALFAIVGTTFGAGNGTTTFNLPDLRQRFPMGKAVSGTGATLGETGGTVDHLHTVDPPNTTSGVPSTTVAATNLTGTAASTTHTHDLNIAQFNSGTANPPYLAVTFIVKH